MQRAPDLLALSMLLAACEGGDGHDGFFFGQAWHMERAPQIFGDDVRPRDAGCSLEVDRSGTPEVRYEWDDLGREVLVESLDPRGVSFTEKRWRGPCLSRIRIQSGDALTVLDNVCEGGWPVHTTRTDESSPGHGLPAVAEATHTRRFDGVRQTRHTEEGPDRSVTRETLWQGDELVLERVLGATGGPVTEHELHWEDGQLARLVTLHDGEPSRQERYERDADGRILAYIYADDRGVPLSITEFLYVGDDPRPVGAQDELFTFDYRWDCPR